MPDLVLWTSSSDTSPSNPGPESNPSVSSTNNSLTGSYIAFTPSLHPDINQENPTSARDKLAVQDIKVVDCANVYGYNKAKKSKAGSAICA
ncbi:hypothetical protein VKT23_008565 [Stygiomarasmius scandens]|uniref:Uncharacterized protein n=1 Tax=Marasmiellus scandens TaxID=2682957 RepID=A0ABR1JHE7_9AGAR